MARQEALLRLHKQLLARRGELHKKLTEDMYNLRNQQDSDSTGDSADVAFESGSDEFGRDFNEQIVVQYYATEGLFENEVRIGEAPETSWVARKRAAGTDVRFWFVVRDDRGGVTWTTRQVHVR